MKKILFLHGFFASGQCVPALALRDAFDGLAEVLTPDLPRHPKAAIEFIRELIDRGRSIFPAITHRPPMKSVTGMFHWPNRY